MEIHGVRGIYRVVIRRDLLRGGVRPEAETLDGREFEFRPGWTITSERPEYAGEWAMVPVWNSATHPYPDDAPPWIASGDLTLVAEQRYEFPSQQAQKDLGL